LAEPRWSEFDRKCMRLALRLAHKAAGRTSPNPMVGAVLARADKIIATGFHKLAGGPHAEIHALNSAGRSARGSTLYLNLEPCSHHGRTPPCADALIAAGIKEVVAGMKDPNSLVAGRGFARLRRAGIVVRVGLYEEECRRLNEAWIKFIVRRMPFVILKLAASLDGKIASTTGDAHWISGGWSREMVHRLRNEVDAVLVGVGTAIADDPQLTCRIANGRDPKRVVLDSQLRIALSAQLFRQREPDKTIIATTARAKAKKIQAVEKLRAQVWKFSAGAEIPWRPLLKKLASDGTVSILIEGGAAVAASALKAKVVDKVMFFYTPKLIGGDGKPRLDGLAVRRVKNALQVERMTIERSGEDILVTAYTSDRTA